MTTPPDPFSPPPAGEPTPPPGYPAPPSYGYPTAPAYGQPAVPYGQPQQQWGAPPPYGSPAGAPPKNGFGVAALVLGIVGIVLCWFPVLGLLLGVAAIVFAILGRKRAGRQEATNGGMAIAGLVLGILTTIVGVVVLAGLAFFGSSISQYSDCVSNSSGSTADIQACANEFQNNVQN